MPLEIAAYAICLSSYLGTCPIKEPRVRSQSGRSSPGVAAFVGTNDVSDTEYTSIYYINYLRWGQMYTVYVTEGLREIRPAGTRGSSIWAAT